MYKELIEQLLNDTESSTLDFKVEQYIFVKASDKDKSELLKDILTFANSWKRAEAFILIGVDEVKGGRSIVKGISEHLDDADLQQFVNSKTNKPVVFSYIPFLFEDKQIGMIKIPIQERPIYLKKDFGGLKKDVVYLRMGSATTIANPEEIYKMGESSLPSLPKATVDFEFGDKENRIGLGDAIKFKCIFNDVAEEPPPSNNEVKGSYFTTMAFPDLQPSYEQYAHYVFEAGILREILFVVSNTGGALLEDVRLKISFLKQDDFYIKKESPKFPQRQQLSAFVNNIPLIRDVSMHSRKTEWEVIWRIGDIQPKDKKWSDSIFLGSKASLKIDCMATIFANNLSEPVSKKLSIRINVEKRVVSAEEINSMMYPKY